MAKKELEIKTYQGEKGKIFVLSQNISGLSAYERAKAIESFIRKETKVLEMAIETYLRQVLRDNRINIQDGSNQALERAFIQLENQGKTIDIVDRYYELNNERIIGESPNEMTVILEDDILSCAMEIIIYE
jgi:hypothetical protein